MQPFQDYRERIATWLAGGLALCPYQESTVDDAGRVMSTTTDDILRCALGEDPVAAPFEARLHIHTLLAQEFGWHHEQHRAPRPSYWLRPDDVERRISRINTPPRLPMPPQNAPRILRAAAQQIDDRAALRDMPAGERSMARCVAAFNALFGHGLTEVDGWQFMSLLKKARASAGAHHLDDYVDDSAYAALAGEAADRGERA